jgi:hypothetical protein
LLRGEQATPFLAGGQRRAVCELCTVRATHEGWIRESGADDLEMRHPRHERRPFMERLRANRRERAREAQHDDVDGVEPVTPLPEPALPPPMTAAADHGSAHAEEAHMADAEIVEADVVDDEGTAPELAVAEQNGAGTPVEETEDVHARVARMSDEELARSYANAVRAAAHFEDGDEQGEYLHALVQAALDEALTRSAFTEDETEPARGLRGRARARRRRRRAVALSELREACRQVREQQIAAVSPS